jgi:dTDP-4-amino-4,6-dideoxygalactose transaminase
MTALNPLGSSFRIPMSDLNSYNASFSDGFAEDLRTLLTHGRYILGDEVKMFETELATYFGQTHAIGVSSGTAALELAFRSLKLNPTDEVIVPANTYIASVFGAAASGGRIVPVDCTSNGTLDLDAVRQAITPNTKAVLVVHLYGDCCPMRELVTICKSAGLWLVEDCAQSLGSRYDGVLLGAWGDISCHSFYPSKNLGALGDAGAIVTNNDDLAKYCRLARNLGVSAKYIHDIPATNARMDTLQAMFLRRKFPDMERVIAAKREVADAYTEAFQSRHIRSDDPLVKHSYHVYAIVMPNRDAVMKRLAEQGIETLIHYPIPFYKSKAFAELNSLSFPNTERLASTMISLPMFATMSSNQITEVVRAIHNEASNGSFGSEVSSIRTGPH